MVFSTLAQMAQVIAVGGSLMTPVALPVQCRMTRAPVININPVTKKIKYVTNKSSAELTAMRSSTISPYGLNVDTATGGLRHDQPYMEWQIEYNIVTDPNTQTFCMAYSEVNLEIKLSPTIYLAKEYNSGRCGQEVLKHEKKHVIVDRKVINKHSQAIGMSIQKAINNIGAVGPFPVSRINEIRASMKGHIESAVSSTKLAMVNDMNRYQQQVDSKAEYDRVGSHCESQSKKAFENIRKQHNH